MGGGGGGGFESLSFYFLFFSFSYSFIGQFELPSAVTNNGGSRRGSEQIISFYRDIQEN